MAPVKPGSYIFDPKSITKIRNKLNMTQKKMSDQLGVPVNTLSRWETGATTPDADSLAAVHSLAVGQGYTPGFFRKSPKASAKPVSASKGEMSKGNRRRLIVMLDFQNLGVSSGNVSHLDDWIMAELEPVRPATTYELYKGFARPDQQAATKELRKLDWKIQEGATDLDKAISQQAKSNCGQDPDSTTLFLITKDGDFAGLVSELTDWGIDVYVGGPRDTSKKLIKALNNGHWIQMPNSWK